MLVNCNLKNAGQPFPNSLIFTGSIFTSRSFLWGSASRWNDAKIQGSVWFSFTLFTSLSAMESNCLLTLQNMYTLQLCLPSADVRINKTTQFINKKKRGEKFGTRGSDSITSYWAMHCVLTLCSVYIIIIMRAGKFPFSVFTCGWENAPLFLFFLQREN